MAEEYAQAMLNHVPDTPTTQSMLPDNLMGSPPESATTTAEPTSPWAGNAGPLPTDQSFMMQGWGDRPSGSRPSQSQASKTWNTAGVGGATGNWGLDMPNPLLSGAAGRGVADNGISPRLAEMVADLSNNPDALSECVITTHTHTASQSHGSNVPSPWLHILDVLPVPRTQPLLTNEG